MCKNLFYHLLNKSSTRLSSFIIHSGPELTNPPFFFLILYISVDIYKNLTSYIKVVSGSWI